MISQENSVHHSTIRLQHAINQFKKKQTDKTTLENKLNILQQKCQTNRKKAKLIKNKVSKINIIKQEYQRYRQDIDYQQGQETEKQMRKIMRQKTLREQSKQNMSIIRNLIAEEKRTEYYRVKERERKNQMRITNSLQKSLHQKRQRSLEVKLQEQNARLTRTVFLQKKRLSTQKRSQFQLQPIQVGTQRTSEQIEQMKRLERQMIDKLSESRQSLRNSKLSLKKIYR